MKRKVHRYFVPSWRNDFKPYFLRAEAAGMLAVCIISLYGLATLYDKTVLAVKSQNVAAVISSVLATLANADRTSNGLHELRVNPLLEKAAQLKANDMVAKGYFAHNAPDGTEPWHWFDVAGYDYAYAGENLAVFFSDSDEVEQAWMRSPTHRANILNDHYDEVGIAVAYGTYQGHPTAFVVQEFGSPHPDAAAMTEAQPAPLPPATASTTGPISTTTQIVAATLPRVIAKTPTFIAVRKQQVKAADVTRRRRFAPRR